MLVTLLADASFCPETRVGGYGYWIASGRGKRGGGGVFRKRLASSALAEMLAIANALYIAKSVGLIQFRDHVIIQTDCQAAIIAFHNGRKLNKDEEDAYKFFINFMTIAGVSTEFRHVKGHSSKKEARYAANKHCDVRARDYMRQARTLYRTFGSDFINHFRKDA